MKMKLFVVPMVSAVMVAQGAYAMGTPEAEEFVQKASMSNMFEIESSKIALQKATDPEVKAFAQQMLDDHTKAGTEMKAAVAEAQLPANLIATKLDDKHQGKIDALNEKKGDDFDQKFVEIQEDAHDDAVSLFEKYADKGESPPLKIFAAKTLPVLKQHEQHVDKMD